MPRPALILAGVASLLAVGGPASARQPPAKATATPAALDADLTITDHVELIEPATVLALP